MSVSPYRAAAFLGSFLLFTIELLAAKALLPRYGGGAQVWTTCMLFFQGVLLLGYLYARLAAGRLGLRAQAALHLGLTALAALPAAAGLRPPPGLPPAAGLLAELALSVGAPFLALSATVPLLQRSLSFSGRPESRSPYALYAWSNAGALAALVSYPFIVEPLLALNAQFLLWWLGYAAYGAVFLATFPAAAAAAPPAAEPAAAAAAAPGRTLAWVMLSAAPCSALLAATSYLSMKMAAVPLLWMAPMAVYLGTFVLYFRPGGFRAGAPGRLLAAAAAAACLAGLILLGARKDGLSLAVGLLGQVLNLAALAVIAAVCHRSLAAEKPGDPGAAPSFYLALALGGFAGSALLGALIPFFGRGIGWPGLEWLAAGSLAVSALVVRDWALWRSKRGFRFAAPAAAAVLAAAAVAGALGGSGNTVASVRNFYGISSVEDRAGLRALMHGGTAHGRQFLDPARSAEPLLYYHKASPAGEAFRLFGGGAGSVGLVGLGAGTMAAYGTPGMKMTFYELDPDVAALALAHFAFIERSAASVEIVPGDGRVSLERAAGARHDMLVLDAYAGGAVPAHLLTKEAFGIYLRRLAPGGLILCNISNRHLDLKPVIAAAAGSLGLHAAVKSDAGPASPESGIGRSQWAALSADPEKIRALRERAGWAEASRFGSRFVRTWTDQYASILPLLRL